MTRAWFSYVVLAIGLMLLMGSERPSVAKDKEIIADIVTFDTERDIQVFVNKQGDESETIDLVIDGKKIQFDLPELAEGETKTFTTDDGSEVVVKAFSDKRVVFVGGEEINLPVLHMNGMMGEEGLSSFITRVHGMDDFQKNTVTLSGHDLSDDAMKAMVEAVQGVLVSYGIEKEVVFSKQPKLHVLTETIQGMDGDFKFVTDGDIEIKVGPESQGQNVMVIEKKVIKKKDKSDK